MDGAGQELTDYLRATAAFRHYPYPEHLEQWAERLLVNRKEIEGFRDLPHLDNLPLQDMPPAPRLDLPKDGGRAPAPAYKIADPTTATAVDRGLRARAAHLAQGCRRGMFRSGGRAEIPQCLHLARSRRSPPGG